MRNILLIIFTIAFPIQSNALNKCTDAIGRSIYQDAPCSDGKELGKVDLYNAKKLSHSEEELRMQEFQSKSRKAHEENERFVKEMNERRKREYEKIDEEAKKKHDDELNEQQKIYQSKINKCGGEIKKGPYIGMKENDFYCTFDGLNYIKTVNKTETINGINKQFVLKNGGIVYTRNGIVNAIQD